MKKKNQIPKMDRRNFLRCGVVGSVIWSVTEATVPAQAESTSGPKNHLPPGKPVIYTAVKWSMIREKLSIEDKFRLLKDLGFDGVHIDDPFHVDPRVAVRAAEKTGIMIHGVVDPTHWRYRLSDPNPAIRERALHDLLRCIELSHAYGGNGVLLVPGHGKDGPEEVVAQRALEQIQKALPLAAKLGVRILIENVWNHFLYDHNGPANQSARRLVEFIDRANSPWVGSFFDIGNHRKYGVPSQWIRELGLRIVKLDVKDYDTRTQKWAEIGEGTVDWENVRIELAKLNFHGWATAEVGGGDRKRLAKIREQMRKVLG